ncbi:uncharacterized protein LOC124226918 isoform X2 [Equus quagga]|uniref:uncharacterized protein LOC124226918 isoform X2 n=1 Tax=Equus quagga TaxID=89248 RepID=UPI001EE276A4|nr:uncharacterized protein LOC124226918 isoform X2 [Equus quagga]
MGWGPGARGQGPGGARTFPRPLRWWRLGVEGTLQKLALRRKKALNAQEMEPDWLRRRLGAPSTPPCSKIRRGRGCELDDPKHFAFLPLPLLESRRPRAELGLEGGDHARPLSLSRLAWARRAPCARRLSLQDPSGPADAARGAPRRPPDAPSVCRAEAADRAPGPCGRVCPHRACLSQEGLFLPRTGASAGPSFSWAPGLQPLWFCSTAPLPCTCLSPGPLGPSSSLAARSLLLQVVFIGLSLGVGALSCFHGNCCGPQKTRAASSSKGRTLWAIPAISLETEDRISGLALLETTCSPSGTGSTPVPPGG